MAQSAVERRISLIRNAFRTQLWPVPLIGILLALALGVGLPQLDVALGDDLPGTLQDYLFGGGAGAASTVLDAIASSLVTVTSLTFSLTVVTLQLASSQFSPRLLRTFMRDRMVHYTLALFLATFTFAMTVLRTVRSAQSGQDEFVPRLSVTVAFTLVIASIIGLVAFLAHLAREIRVETMIRNVHDDASTTVRQVLADRDPGEHDHPPLVEPPDGAVALLAGDSGFVGFVDQEDIVAAARKADAIVLIDRMPGASITVGTPMGAAWPRQGTAPLSQRARTSLQEEVAAAVDADSERTGTEDVTFGLRQLTDVASKALSPGINDPTTAVHTLGETCALLCELAGKQLGPITLRDDDDEVRVILRRATFTEIVELAVTQPRRYGKADPAVLYRLATLLRELAWVALPDQRAVIRGQLERLRQTAGEQDFDEPQVQTIAIVCDQVEAALLGRWVKDESLA